MKEYNQQQSCGQSRFGCWICTVVQEDRSLNAVSFLGSVNETLGGWINNEESFEVSQNWIPVLQSSLK